MTECFGSCWRPPGAGGGRHWSSSNPRPSSDGIAPGCVGGGLSARDATALVGPRSILTSPDSSPTWHGANPLWGAPRIHGELRKLGIEISERTVSRLLAQLSRPPSQPWRTFLANHLSALVSMDFFTVSTLTGRVLFVLVLMSHDRRRIVHVNVTEHPTSAWTAQQLVEASSDAARSPASGDHTATTSFFFHRETRFVSREERQPLPSVGAVREDWETVIPTSGPQLDWDGERIYGRAAA